MAVFPTRVLLATDGSADATLAAQSAVELCEMSGSELHVVHVGEYLPTYFAFTEEEPAELRESARRLLEGEVERIRAAGGRVTETYLRLGRPAEQIVGLSEEIGAGGRGGRRQPGSGRPPTGRPGQRLRVRRPLRLLPRLRGTRGRRSATTRTRRGALRNVRR